MPACTATETRCAVPGGASLRCVSTQTDRAHCGACGNACARDQVCSGGACTFMCTGTATECAGGAGGMDAGAPRYCAELMTDRTDCGACGNTCMDGYSCQGGVCRIQCAELLVQCPTPGADAGPSGGGEMCGNTTNDVRNCGACGTTCALGQFCVRGVCQTMCGAGFTQCGGICRDLTSDREGCGMCGNACGSGELCVAGRCVVSCGGGLMACDGVCRDLTSDLNNCGTCGTRCMPGQVCSRSACTTTCGAGLTDCTGTCRDLINDRLNCGGCGTVCPSGQTCVARVCTLVCPTGQTNCAGVCRDLQSDSARCGSCTTVCASGTVCSAGSCVVTCAAGLTNCSGSCTSTATDPRNCGACGTVCPARANATATCGAGTCGFTCNAGFADCNRNPVDGCEVNIGSDTANCGGCGTVCTIANGFGDCNAVATDGCEVNTTSSSTNCGACGVVCAGGGACTGGTCGARCYTGAARVLIYGPGNTRGSGMFPAGTMVTVASDAIWRSMTAAQFGQYDIIWIDGGNCGGTTESNSGTAQDTLAAWGPAVRGRIVLLTGDPDYHQDGQAPLLYQNSVNWLKGMGRNVDGGRTSLFMSWGCTMCCGFVSGRGTPETFTSVLGAGFTTNTTNFCAATLTGVAASHPVTVGFSAFWGCPMHGAFGSIASGYTTLAVSGGLASLVARDSPVACVP